jgi:hypothetical protein
MHAGGTGMVYRALADIVVIVHFLFVVFVILGGFLTWRWRRVAWGHLPAAVWGVAIEFGGWICPLTPLENALRARAGVAGYSGGFIEHHMIAWLYPAGLTPSTQVLLGAVALLVNVIAYGLLWGHPRRHTVDRC